MRRQAYASHAGAARALAFGFSSSLSRACAGRAFTLRVEDCQGHAATDFQDVTPHVRIHIDGNGGLVPWRAAAAEISMRFAPSARG